MIKAAFFDLDGTLLSHRTHAVPESARESLALLTARGIRICLCTGRHPSELPLLPVADIRFDACVALNGHLCLDSGGRKLFGLPFPEETVRALIAGFAGAGLPLMLVEENGRTLSFADGAAVQAHKAHAVPASRIAAYDGRPVYQATTRADRSRDALIRSLLPPDCLAVRWNDEGVDLILRGGEKPAGIRAVLTCEGIRPEECIAFGDAENDADMLRFCGVGVAMGNAPAAVKAAADYVTSDVDRDGIRNALRHYGIL